MAAKYWFDKLHRLRSTEKVEYMIGELETLKHIRRVRQLLDGCIADLIRRGGCHDNSKLEEPEKSVFEEYTAKLRGCTYGSGEYKGFLAAMKPALDHHYANNAHHPEFHGLHICIQCGVDDRIEPCTCGGPRRADVSRMSLLDILEMLVDWKAATERHADGDLAKSIEINQKRFGYSDELKAILTNTAQAMGWIKQGPKMSG